MLQLAGGRHFLMDNPFSSAAWKIAAMVPSLQDPRIRSVVVDMCRFGLCYSDGGLHRKPTKFVFFQPGIDFQNDGHALHR